MPKGHVYIIASKRNGTIYTGVTINSAARTYAQRGGNGSNFAKKYAIRMLVWYETYDLVTDAIQCESNIKYWLRRWKLTLIEKVNPEWNDLQETLG